MAINSSLSFYSEATVAPEQRGIKNIKRLMIDGGRAEMDRSWRLRNQYIDGSIPSFPTSQLVAR